MIVNFILCKMIVLVWERKLDMAFSMVLCYLTHVWPLRLVKLYILYNNILVLYKLSFCSIKKYDSSLNMDTYMGRYWLVELFKACSWIWIGAEAVCAVLILISNRLNIFLNTIGCNGGKDWIPLCFF